MRAGRKRKPEAPRKRGRIDWWAANEDPTLLPVWNKAREAYMAFGRQPRLSSQAGKLYCFRMLSDLEMDAAERWCEFLTTYDRVVLARSRSVQPSSLERLGVNLGSDWDEDQVRIFRARFDAAQSAILRYGRHTLVALNRLCRDEASSSVLPQAKVGLTALIIHFGLKPQKPA